MIQRGLGVGWSGLNGVAVGKVVAAVQELRVHQPAVGDVDLGERPAGADGEDPLVGCARLPDQLVEVRARLPEHLEPGQQRALGADVVDVDQLSDRRLVRDMDAAPRLRTEIVAVDHRRLTATCRTATEGGSSAS
jgi:hypothetical protein